jgi:hypothetical protein
MAKRINLWAGYGPYHILSINMAQIKQIKKSFESMFEEKVP